MKSIIFLSWVALTLLLMTAQLGARTRGKVAQGIAVNVPFDFMVQQFMFPAGNYTVSRLIDRTLQLQAGHGGGSVSIATAPIRSATHPGTARLIFDQESGHYRLRELWMNSATGVRILAQRVEQLRTVRGSRVEVPASCTTCK